MADKYRSHSLGRVTHCAVLSGPDQPSCSVGLFTYSVAPRPAGANGFLAAAPGRVLAPLRTRMAPAAI